MRAILFLDIDGVMNSPRGKGPYFADMEEDKLFRLSRLCKESSAFIVLISDRRYDDYYMKDFLIALERFDIPFLGITRRPKELEEDLYDSRGKQIMDYLAGLEEEIVAIAILDDNDDGISSLFPEQFIKVNRYYGLDDCIKEKVRQILKDF